LDAPEAAFSRPQGQTSRFAAPDWSLVLAALGAGSHEARPALHRLVETSSHPL